MENINTNKNTYVEPPLMDQLEYDYTKHREDSAELAHVRNQLAELRQQPSESRDLTDFGYYHLYEGDLAHKAKNRLRHAKNYADKHSGAIFDAAVDMARADGVEIVKGQSRPESLAEKASTGVPTMNPEREQRIREHVAEELGRIATREFQESATTEEANSESEYVLHGSNRDRAHALAEEMAAADGVQIQK